MSFHRHLFCKHGKYAGYSIIPGKCETGHFNLVPKGEIIGAISILRIATKKIFISQFAETKIKDSSPEKQQKN